MSLTSTSRRPCSASIRSSSASTCAGWRWSAAPRSRRPPRSTELRRLLDRLRAVVLRLPLAGRAAGAVDGRARLAQRHRDAPAGAPGRACDERHLACQRTRGRRHQACPGCAITGPARAAPRRRAAQCAPPAQARQKSAPRESIGSIFRRPPYRTSLMAGNAAGAAQRPASASRASAFSRARADRRRSRSTTETGSSPRCARSLGSVQRREHRIWRSGAERAAADPTRPLPRCATVLASQPVSLCRTRGVAPMAVTVPAATEQIDYADCTPAGSAATGRRPTSTSRRTASTGTRGSRPSSAAARCGSTPSSSTARTRWRTTSRRTSTPCRWRSRSTSWRPSRSTRRATPCSFIASCTRSSASATGRSATGFARRRAH